MSPGDNDDLDRLAFFDALLEGSRRAEAATGSALTRSYSVGELTICLRFAGPALLSALTPAIAHLETNPAKVPALTISLWDSASTGTRLPLLVASLIQLLRLRWWEQLDGRREIRGYSSPRLRASFHLGPDILSALNTLGAAAVYWVEDASTIPYYERGYPLQTLLNWWAEGHGRYYVHAAAIGTTAGGALLAGRGGSGKSTTTLACARAGLGVAGDDYTLVSVDPVPYGYSLYNTVKLKALEDIDRFPQLLPSLSNADRLAEEKPMLSLHNHYPQCVLRSFPIRAILLPQVRRGTDTWLEPSSPIDALRALAPSTILQLPGNGQAAFGAMARLVRSVPCYTLALGTDLAQIPAAIAHLLDGLP